jgi:CubicO group peptidase (beta-lactamase class C family)
VSEVTTNRVRPHATTAAALIVALYALAAIDPATVAHAAATGSIDDHIAAVEDGLIPSPQITGELGRKHTLAERMSFYKAPAVSVAVINNYEIEWARAWGTTEAGGTQPVNPDTLFQAGSISKPVAAMGVMSLVQQGKLSLDTNVNDVLKSWKVPDNEFTRVKPVTLRELLTHSAGTNVHGFFGYNVRIERPSVVQVLKGVAPANSPPVVVEYVPGSKWQYSGGGIEIVQQMVVDVTGIPFAEFMQTTVLRPLGMDHSTYEQPLPTAMQENAAAGTHADGTEVSGRWHVYPEQAAAGLWTTPSDLARFVIALMNAERGLGNPVISVTTGKEMLIPERDAEDGAQMGLGIFVFGSGSDARFFHAGADEGFQAQLLGYDAGYGVVVMVNSDNGLSLAAEIIQSVKREYGWPP